MIQKIKDFLTVFREGIIICLFVLLLFFPTCFNRVLEKAGFTEGSLMGFTWKQKAIESKQVADSSQQIAEAAHLQMQQMQNKLDSISKLLANMSTASQTPEVHAITDEINKSKATFQINSMIFKDRLQFQKNRLSTITKEIMTK